MTTCIVYGLYSSRKPDALRYVGQTTQVLATRMRQHRNYAKNKKTAVHKWWLREVAEGFVIEARILCEEAIFNVTEIALIAQHRNDGARLLNHTLGGEGTLGWHGHKGKPRPYMIERNKRNKGKPGHAMSPENEAKLRAANKIRDTTYLVVRNKTNHPWIGRKHTEETKAKIGLAHKGKIVTPETGRKISESKKGIKLTPEAIARLRAGHKAYFDAKRAANV